jgi:Ion channel
VPSIYSLLMQIPDELKPWMAMGIGSFILVCIVLFHGTGIHWILQLYLSGQRRLLKGRPHVFRALVLFGSSVFLMLALHLVGVLAWTLVLLKMGLIQKAHDAIYFCANAYTTLGYGNVDLDPLWRNISPIIGISGLFTFAWTTSVLVTVVGAHNRLLEQLHLEREKEIQMRADLRKTIAEERGQERQAERAVIAKEQIKASETGFWNRWRIWLDEKREVVELRKEELVENTESFRKERADEEKLGPEQQDVTKKE